MSNNTIVKTYILVFTDYEEEVPAGNFKEICESVFEKYNPSNDPETIILPSGEEIAWNAYVVHSFIAKGRITEEECIELLRKKQ